MISERILTPVLRQILRRSLKLKSITAGSLPAPRRGHRYMLYAHVPFCESLCPYCSFNRFVFNEKMARAYFASLRAEMRMVAELGYVFNSIYIGGGTPTILPDELAETIELGQQLFGAVETSCETNPNHLTPAILARLSGHVQRLSVGVQSFDNALLKQMTRHAKYGSGEEIFQRLQQCAGIFPTLNVDMIFNFPSQTADSLREDVRKIVASGASQVSFYPLMTAPTVAQSLSSTIGRVDYRREAQFYEIICDGLGGAFYPTSAWTFSRRSGGMIDEYIVDYEEYVGIGSGSFSYLNGHIFVNTFSLSEYEQRVAAGRLPLAASRSFWRLEQMRYRFMMELFGLRLDKERFRRDFGLPVELALAPEMAFMQLSGAFEQMDDKALTLTHRGRYLLLAMMREFFSGVDRVREQARHALSAEERSLMKCSILQQVLDSTPINE